LVNRVHELAGLRDGLAYQSDPRISAMSEAARTGDLNAHLKVLREQGWEAFRDSRDALYGERGGGRAGD
jgi:hypothetical protein